jgi:hypothetical protein
MRATHPSIQELSSVNAGKILGSKEHLNEHWGNNIRLHPKEFQFQIMA